MEQDPEIKILLKRSIALGEENNKILKGMQRSARISSILRFIYWIIIIALTVQAYYFIEPYLKTILNTYSQMQTTETKVSNFNLADYIKNFGKSATSTSQ